jgi:hypothetical protein
MIPSATPDLAELRRLAEAATPGPWRWEGHRNRGMHLSTVDRGRQYVMGFIRQGMQGAQPTFQVRDEDGYGLMTPASELAVQEVEYRDDITHIEHPDAAFIVAANPATILSLLDRAEAATQPGEGLLDERALRQACYDGLPKDADDDLYAVADGIFESVRNGFWINRAAPERPAPALDALSDAIILLRAIHEPCAVTGCLDCMEIRRLSAARSAGEEAGE